MGEESAIGRIGMLLLVIMLMLFMVGSCTDLSFGGGTRTCESCGMSYEDDDPGNDYSNIGKTNLCCDCYEIYQWARGD